MYFSCLSHQPKCPMCRKPGPKDFIVLGDSVEKECDCAGSKEEETDEDRGRNLRILRYILRELSRRKIRKFLFSQNTMLVLII